MGKQAPSAPDPNASAQAQYNWGTQAAAYNKGLNATNQVGPTGSTTNAITGYGPGGAPQYTQTTTLSPIEQELLAGTQAGGLGAIRGGAGAYNNVNALTGEPLNRIGAAPTLQTTMDTSQIPGLPSTAAVGGVQDQATQQVMAQERAQLDPMWNAEEESTKAQLINSGNGPGTPMWEQTIPKLDSQRDAAYTQATGVAARTGAEVGQTMFGEGATANQQAYTESLQRMVAENQAKGMSQQDAIAAAQAQIAQFGGWAGAGTGLYGAAGVNIPTASGLPTSAASTPDIMSAFQNQYQGELAQYNANVGTTNSVIGDIGSIAALAIMSSDRRLKTDIEETGYELPEMELPVYLFRYRGEPEGTRHIGVMAQDVEDVAPEAVFRDHRGYRAVDYGQLR